MDSEYVSATTGRTRLGTCSCGALKTYITTQVGEPLAMLCRTCDALPLAVIIGGSEEA